MNVTQIAAVYLIVSAINFNADVSNKVSLFVFSLMVVVFAVCALRAGKNDK